MPVSKKQLQRLVKIVSLLKENRYPNTGAIVRYFNSADLYESHYTGFGCTAKTVSRDIKFLKEALGAPIRYDVERKGYFLLNPQWTFDCPMFDDAVMTGALLGARIAEQILPEPLRSLIRNAVDCLLTSNETGMSDEAEVSSLIVKTSREVPDGAVFALVFEAWQKRNSIRVEYLSNGRMFSGIVNPHVLLFENGIWSIVCDTPEDSAVLSLELAGVKNAFNTDRKFIYRKDMAIALVNECPALEESRTFDVAGDKMVA